MAMLSLLDEAGLVGKQWMKGFIIRICYEESIIGPMKICGEKFLHLAYYHRVLRT